MRAVKSHFTSWVDEGTGTGSVRNATHTRAIQSHFTYGVVDLSWEGKRTGIQEVIYAEQNSYTNNR